MDIGLKFTRTQDKELIKKILLDKSLLETTAEDGCLDINAESDCYLACVDNGEVIGIAVFSPESRMTINYHPNLLKEHRGKRSIDFTLKALEWLYDNAEMYQKVNVKFPRIYKHIEVYAIKAGFTFEGVDRQSCKNGDRLCYGITRSEIGKIKGVVQ